MKQFLRAFSHRTFSKQQASFLASQCKYRFTNRSPNKSQSSYITSRIALMTLVSMPLAGYYYHHYYYKNVSNNLSINDSNETNTTDINNTHWQINASKYILSKVLTHPIYTNRTNSPMLDKGQRELMVTYCYDIYNIINELLEKCPNCQEKGILMATIIQIKYMVDFIMGRPSRSPDIARNEICDNLRNYILNAGKTLNFDIEQSEIKWFHPSIPYTAREYDKNSVASQLKYYVKRRVKCDGYLYDIVEEAIQLYGSDSL